MSKTVEPSCVDETECIDDPLIGPSGPQLDPTAFQDIQVKIIDEDKQVQELEKQMKIWYEAANLPKLVSIKEHGFYVARLPTDKNHWSRIYIIEVRDNDAHVLLIDHGLQISLLWDNIYPMRKRYRELPVAAIPATIATLEPSKCWTEHEKQIFQADLLGVPVTGVVIGKSFNKDVMPYEILSLIIIIPGSEDTNDKIYTFHGRYKFGYKLKF